MRPRLLLRSGNQREEQTLNPFNSVPAGIIGGVVIAESRLND